MFEEFDTDYLLRFCILHPTLTHHTFRSNTPALRRCPQTTEASSTHLHLISVVRATIFCAILVRQKRRLHITLLVRAIAISHKVSLLSAWIEDDLINNLADEENLIS